VASGYLTRMLASTLVGFIDPCIPTLAAKPPAGADWVYEVKHDRYRLIVRRDAISPGTQVILHAPIARLRLPFLSRRSPPEA
jgi:hypothetical protein